MDCPSYSYTDGAGNTDTRSAHVESNTLTVTTLSGEYTRADLKAEVEAAMPTLDDDWDDTAGVYLNYSGWSASARKGKWRIVHRPTATCYLKIWLQSRWQPKGGGAPVLTPLAPYVWTGSGSPCFPDPEKSPADTENLILGSSTAEGIPDDEGTFDVDILKWSFLSDYEPGDGDPNGFPPEEELP